MIYIGLAAFFIGMDPLNLNLQTAATRRFPGGR